MKTKYRFATWTLRITIIVAFAEVIAGLYATLVKPREYYDTHLVFSPDTDRWVFGGLALTVIGLLAAMWAGKNLVELKRFAAIAVMFFASLLVGCAVRPRVVAVPTSEALIREILAKLLPGGEIVEYPDAIAIYRVNVTGHLTDGRPVLFDLDQSTNRDGKIVHFRQKSRSSDPTTREVFAEVNREAVFILRSTPVSMKSSALSWSLIMERHGTKALRPTWKYLDELAQMMVDIGRKDSALLASRYCAPKTKLVIEREVSEAAASKLAPDLARGGYVSLKEVLEFSEVVLRFSRYRGGCPFPGEDEDKLKADMEAFAARLGI